MRRRELFWVAIILVLLLVVLFVSGMFYFSKITADSGLTGRVVLADDSENEVYSWDGADSGHWERDKDVFAGSG